MQPHAHYPKATPTRSTFSIRGHCRHRRLVLPA
jgi:hypothetical protein